MRDLVEEAKLKVDKAEKARFVEALVTGKNVKGSKNDALAKAHVRLAHSFTSLISFYRKRPKRKPKLLPTRTSLPSRRESLTKESSNIMEEKKSLTGARTMDSRPLETSLN